MSDSALYRDLAYVFVAAVLGGLVARRLRQPLVIGYVLGGIIIGPFIAGPSVSEIQVLELIAEIGVSLLMYSIGVEFSVRDLLQVRWVFLVGGPLGILAVIGLALGGGSLMGWSTLQSVSIGAVVSLSSTMVLTRVLTDRGELHSEQGRVMVGITLVNDLVFVVMTVLLPSLGSMSGSRPLEVGLAFGKALAILVPVALVAAKVIPPLMARVPRTENQDLRVLVALGLGFVTAAATQALGLSLAASAFLAGMMVSGSNVADGTLTNLLPLGNSLTALFFVTIGALIDLEALLSNLRLLGMLVLLIVVGKFLIWTVVVWLFRYPLRTAVLVAVGLTQIGEFSYVLVKLARDARLVDNDIYSATLAASLLTILLNAFLMRIVPGWIAGLGTTPAEVPRHTGRKSFKVS